MTLLIQIKNVGTEVRHLSIEEGSKLLYDMKFSILSGINVSIPIFDDILRIEIEPPPLQLPGREEDA